MRAEDRYERLAATLRLVVAATAFVIFAADPSEHPERRPFAHAVLALFAGYSAISYVLAVRRGRSIRTSLVPWIDVAWVTLAVAVSQATSGIFNPLYLFPILCASFWYGFRRGLAVAVTSAAAFAIVGAATAPAGVDLRLFLVRPLYLLVLGYLIAVWVGHEVRSRARLALLRDVSAFSTPSLGLAPAVGNLLEAVRAFFEADSCRLVVADEHRGERWTRAAFRGAGADGGPTILPREVADALLPAPADAAFLIRARRRGDLTFQLHGAPGPREGDPAVASALLVALDAAAILSVSFRYHAGAPARLYVARSAPRGFDRSDAEFLRQLVDQMVPVLENLRLVDHLAVDAARDERRRIALDLHDSVIQPYLGLRLGLSAASTALAAGRVEEGAAHIDRLVELADGEIETLRGYVRELRAECAAGAAGPDASIRRFCLRFSEATGIRVDVATAGDPLAAGLGADVIPLVAEALSNVRRHTRATRAEVRIEADAGRLNVTVVNDGTPAEPVAFFPRSLAERAASLGGSLSVHHPARGATAVRVEIPLDRPGAPS